MALTIEEELIASRVIDLMENKPIEDPQGTLRILTIVMASISMASAVGHMSVSGSTIDRKRASLMIQQLGDGSHPWPDWYADSVSAIHQSLDLYLNQCHWLVMDEFLATNYKPTVPA